MHTPFYWIRRWLVALVLIWASRAPAVVVDYEVCRGHYELGFGSGVGGADSAIPIDIPGDATHAPTRVWQFDATKAGIPQNIHMDISVPETLADNTMRCVADWTTTGGPNPQQVKWDCGTTVVVQGVVESTITGKEATTLSTGSPVLYGLPNTSRQTVLSGQVLWDSLRVQPCQVNNCAGFGAVVWFDRDTTIGSNTPNAATLSRLCVIMHVTQ